MEILQSSLAGPGRKSVEPDTAKWFNDSGYAMPMNMAICRQFFAA